MEAKFEDQNEAKKKPWMTLHNSKFHSVKRYATGIGAFNSAQIVEIRDSAKASNVYQSAELPRIIIQIQAATVGPGQSHPCSQDADTHLESFTIQSAWTLNSASVKSMLALKLTARLKIPVRLGQELPASRT